MKLDEYLKSEPHWGANQKSDWLFVDTLNVSHGTLWAGDPYVCDGEDGAMIEVPVGEYVIEAQVNDIEGSRIIGRVRARKAVSKNVSLGETIGDTGTDSALIAICDMKAVNEAVSGDDEGFQTVIDTFLFERYGKIQFEMKSAIEIPYVTSGFGDGTGPVYELAENGDCVGIELDFISED